MPPKTQILCTSLFNLLRGCFVFRLHLTPSPPPHTPQHTIQVEKVFQHLPVRTPLELLEADQSHLNPWLNGGVTSQRKLLCY